MANALDLELFLKGVGGIEQTVEGGTSRHQPALGFEPRLNASLYF